MNLDFRSPAPRAGAMAFHDRSQRSRVCADCKYAQRFTLQPRALCMHDGAPLCGRARPAAQPACAAFAARSPVDLTMTAWILTGAVASAAIVRGRAA